MANRLLNVDMRKANAYDDDDDFETDPDFVNTDNIDNSKQTQKVVVPVRASDVGRDLLQKQAPVDKTPSTPPSRAKIQHTPSTYTPPGVVVSKKPAAIPTNTTSAPVKTASTPVSSVASKFSQPSVSTPAPIKAAAPVKTASTPVSSVASKFSQTPAPVKAAPPIVKATPPPAAPVKKPPPPPKRVEPVYQEPVYEEPAYEEPAYEEPAYEEPAQEQYYDDQQQQYDQQSYDQQGYDDQQQQYDQQSYDQQGYDDQQQQQYDTSSYPQAEALYDYVAQQEGDLTFYTGDIIYVYDTSDESGWYTGECNGVSGAFPSTFVKFL